MAPSLESTVAPNGNHAPDERKNNNHGNVQDFHGYDHITWYVGNAKQAASWYVTRFGFKIIAYRGLETGSQAVSAYVISNGEARFVLVSPIRSAQEKKSGAPKLSTEDSALLKNIHSHLEKHGDGVKDVAFRVDNASAMYKAALAGGAKPVKEPMIVKDETGQIDIATIEAFGDTTHTFIEYKNYNGTFLPGYRGIEIEDPIVQFLPTVKVDLIDHCVGNQDWDEMNRVVDFYERTMNFHRYWTIDDQNMCSDYSAMNSVVVSSANGVIKMPINEPARGKKTSQVEEFVRYFESSGVQHIALLTNDIVTTVTNLKRRGVEMITVPDTYYEDLQKRLDRSPTTVNENLQDLKHLNILIDFDDHGYLLQIFTKPLLDRPTVFLEIIQRNNFDGFGAGNFKSLFEAVEREQAKRGTL